MAIFETGKVIDLLAWLVIWALTAYALLQARQGKTRDVRFLPGIPAILEGINKSTEEGKPAMFLHCGKLYGPNALSVLASLNVCSYTAQNCALLGPDLISVAMEYPETYPVMIETVKEAYTAAGKGDAYRDEMVRYYPGYSYTMEVMGLIEQETPGVIVFMGRWDHSSIIQSTTGYSVGALQVAGTDGIVQLPFFIANCDYVLIGEEFLAAGAKVSEDPVAISSIYAQDIFRIILVGVLVLAALTMTIGTDALLNLWVS
jgi:hypothetical protein